MYSPSSTVPISSGGTDATTASNARTNLGLGTVATQTAVTKEINLLSKEKKKLITKRVTTLTTNIKNWLTKECVDNSFELTDEMVQLIELQVKKNIQKFYFETVKTYHRLKPYLECQSEEPPKDFISNPVHYLLINENFKCTKCRTVIDFPMRGTERTVYTATLTNKHYYWNNEKGNYSRIPFSKTF